jgi:hypothetical protein
LSHFLGMEVTTSANGLVLTQTQYFKTLLTITNMHQAKPCKTPLQASIQLTQESGPLMSDPTLYRSTVGALQYATITRPDLTFAVNKVSQFMSRPTEAHWQSVKRILRYLNGTLHLGLHIQSSPSLCLHAYSDSDWAGCPDDHKSTSGYAVYLRLNLVSWSSKK